jgi:hypothetical protein
MPAVRTTPVVPTGPDEFEPVVRIDRNFLARLTEIKPVARTGKSGQGGSFMKKTIALGWVLAALGWSVVPALAETAGCGCCCEQACTIEKPTFHVEITEHKCTVPVKAENPYTVKATVVEKDVPFCRMVPVCVTDPCTGCTHTECKEEHGVERVKVKVYDIIPPAESCTTKTEEKVTRCATVNLSYIMVPVPPPPPCPPSPCCGH